jgi:tRNA-uridine 2-sulfurtransferase
LARKKTKALFLFSGGLDSLVGVRLLEAQGIKVDLIFFESYFFKPDQARLSAKSNNLKLKVVDFSEQQLESVKKPRHGYGRAMNPCVDCHALMLRLAREMMLSGDYDFVATGEVLGQRPMSQTKNRLKLVEKESGLQGFLLRPLSAQLLQITVPEKMGQVDREKLGSISGRSRKQQISLAEKFKLVDYPNPAGGCLLTDKEFSIKLKDLIEIKKNLSSFDIALLSYGRHYWFKKFKIVVGRDETENDWLRKNAVKNDVLVYIKDLPGPLTLIRSYGGRVTKGAVGQAMFLTKKHAPKVGNRQVVFEESRVD